MQRDSRAAVQPVCHRTIATRTCGRSLRDIWVFVVALRLARYAQKVLEGHKLNTVVDTLSRRRWQPSGLEPQIARCAALRASRYLARFRRKDDTCLVRALVLSSLLSDQPGVLLHIGFRSASDGGSLIAGHAWVTVGDVDVSGDRPVRQGQLYTCAQHIPIERQR